MIIVVCTKGGRGVVRMKSRKDERNEERDYSSIATVVAECKDEFCSHRGSVNIPRIRDK